MPVSNRSGAKWTAAAVLGVLIAVAAILALVRERGSGARTDASTAGGTGSAGASALSGNENPLEGTTAETARSAEATPTADASLGKGVLRLAFVGDPDGAPVPDVPFLVRTERGDTKELARGTSDAKGRAEVRDLEADVILVETPRHPPYAQKIAACRLGKGETKDLVVHLDGGARVSGRVVDDLGQPVEGAELLLDSDLVFGKSTKSVIQADSVTARTGADGRFVLEHLADTPYGIWVVDGEARPERWNPAMIYVRKEACVVYAHADVKPGDAVDIGDVVLARFATIAGVVLDAEGHPVKGALVSPLVDRLLARELGPRAAASPEEELRPRRGETTTGDGGKFELRLGEPRHLIAVWTAWGQRQAFDLQKLGPGERIDDIELRLEAITMLEVELVDERGQRITGPGPSAREPGIFVFSQKSFSSTTKRAEMAFDLDDGTVETDGAVADADALFRFEWKFPVSRVRGVRVSMAGYEPFRARYDSGLAPGARLTCVLKETPPLRIRLRRATPPPEGDAATREPARVWAQICLATPEQRRGPPSMTQRCCGLGAAIHLEWRGEERTFSLPASGGRPFWFYFVGFDRGFVDVASFGPFEPGDEVHDVEVDPETLRAETDANATRKPPTDASKPGEGVKSGLLSFRIVDAKSGDPIPRGRAEGEPMDEEAKKSRAGDAFADEKGRAVKRSFPSGSWTITFKHDGYRDTVRTGVLVRASEETDLGTIALDPTPGLRGRVLDADGEPPSAEAWIQVRSLSTPDPEIFPGAQTDDEGRFVLRAELPESPILEISEMTTQSHGIGRSTQRLPASDWKPDEEKVFRLAPWQRVEVRIGGAAADPPGSGLTLSACPAPGEPTANCDHRGTVPPGHAPMLAGNEILSDPAHRVFRFGMAPGRYQVFGTGLLHDVPVQVIEVKDSSDVQVFDLDSR